MVFKKVLVNYYNFNPIWVQVQHVSIHAKSTGTQVNKGSCQGILSNLIWSRAGAGAAIQICSEPKVIFSAQQH
jgi:hypothetical protein